MSDGGRFYHIGFSRGDLGASGAQLALLCGDPERAWRLAHQTPGVRPVRTLSEHRGLNSYLAELEGVGPLVTATSGMGAPSLSIVVNELVSAGMRRIIRVGTCGSIAEGVGVGSLVISSAALCRQGAADDIAPPEYPAAADPFVAVALYRAARRLGVEAHLGITASVDTFYEGQERGESSANPHLLRRLQGVTEEYRHLGVLNYEMEAGTLFKMAGVYGFSAGCVCAVLAARTQSEKVRTELKRRAEADAIAVALEAVRRLAEEE